MAETLAFGSPDTIARHIEEMRQLGVGQVMCWLNFGGLWFYRDGVMKRGRGKT